MYLLGIIGFFLAIFLAAVYYDKYSHLVQGGSDWDVM